MSKIIKTIFCLVAIVGVGLMVASCSSDEEITQGNADNTLVSEAKSYP